MRELVGPQVPDVGAHRGVRGIEDRHPAAGSVGLAQQPLGEGAQKRDPGAALVEVAPAHVVVRVVRVRAEREEWPVGRMTDFLTGGGPRPLGLSDSAVAYLAKKLAIK